MALRSRSGNQHAVSARWDQNGISTYLAACISLARGRRAPTKRRGGIA